MEQDKQVNHQTQVAQFLQCTMILAIQTVRLNRMLTIKKLTFKIGLQLLQHTSLLMIKNALSVFLQVKKAWHVIYDTPKDNYYFGDVANDGAFGEELYYFPDARKRSLKALDNFARINAVLLPSW